MSLSPSVRLSVRPSVRPSVRNARVVKWKTSVLGAIFGMYVDGGGMGCGVGCPRPPVRNDIVTPRYLFFHHLLNRYSRRVPIETFDGFLGAPERLYNRLCPTSLSVVCSVTQIL